MHRVRIHTAVSWALLAYFALFVVPPASTFAASDHGIVAGAGAGSSIVRDSRQAEVLLFDIILWQQLKKTKQSEEVFAVFPGDDAGVCDKTASQGDGHSNLLQTAALFPGLVRSAGSFSFNRRSRSSAIRFSRSGVSPPAFFS